MPDNLQSPVGKTSNPKAPARVAGKRRAGSANNGTIKRATRRELKKLTEIDLEEKNDVPKGWFPAALDSGQNVLNLWATYVEIHSFLHGVVR